MICSECGSEFIRFEEDEDLEADVCLQCQIEQAREHFPELLPEEYQ